MGGDKEHYERDRAVTTRPDIEERVVDNRGRLYLSRSMRGKKLFIKRVGRVYIVAESLEELEKAAEALQASREMIIDEYVRLIEELGEPSVEELEEAVREASWAEIEKAT